MSVTKSAVSAKSVLYLPVEYIISLVSPHLIYVAIYVLNKIIFSFLDPIN